MTWKPYQNIVQHGVTFSKPHLPLASMLGQKYAVVLTRIGMATPRSNFSQTQRQRAKENATHLNSFQIPEFILREMLQKVNFRRHPKNAQKVTYTLCAVGQRGAIGRAASSMEEVCQIIWDEYQGDWKNQVSLRK